MTTEKVERRLAAILAADVVGYSRLMEADETGTLARLEAHRKELTDPKTAEHNGRLVKLMGDGSLVEFASVVDAVQCAVEIQRGMRERNADVPENERIDFRIGINVGDIIVRDDDIYGDGVNVAARMEQLAEPGGICISDDAFRQVERRSELNFADLGEQSIKNIARPVRAYRVLLELGAAGTIIAQADKKTRLTKRWRWTIPAAVAVVVIGAAAGVLLTLEPWVPRVEAAVEKKMAFSLPEKPSVAVLPFKNLSSDPEQEYLADGISETIITALSRTANLFVIASNSAFTYKNRAVKVGQIAEELGVRYVLEGSFQRSGESVRITARLIDAIGGRQMWSERYDRKLTDIFALQDEIARLVLTELQVKLTVGESARTMLAGTIDPEAYEAVLRGRASLAKFNRDENLKAREQCGKAVALDPNYATAHACLGATYRLAHLFLWEDDRAAALAKARVHIDEAVALDEHSAYAVYQKGFLYLANERDPDKAMPLLEKAVQLDPNGARGRAGLAIALIMAGKPLEGIEQVKQAMRLHPFYPAYYIAYLVEGHMWAGNHEEVVRLGQQYFDYDPLAQRSSFSAWVHAFIAFSQMALSREEEAAKHIEKAREIEPKLSASYFRENKANKSRKDVERLVSVLVRAGLPEHPPLPLPDKPSIAVMPLDNLSDDPAQEWFADGMTDDLITDLSKISGLFVIARNSVYTYKRKAADVKTIGHELGVRYVLEGSVRRSGNHVRINTQLVDTTTGGHVWAERYDRELDDIFAVQDAILAKVVEALELHLSDGEQARRDQGPKTTSLEAYDLVLKARKLLTSFDHSAAADARDLLQRAIELDPAYSEAYSLLGFHYFDEWRVWGRKRGQNLARALELGTRAAELTPLDPSPHVLLALVYQWRREFAAANAAADAALALQPNDAITLSGLGSMLKWAGRSEEALDVLQRAVRLDPFHPPTDLQHLASAYGGVGDYDLCVETAKRGIALEPNYVGLYVSLTSCLSALGLEEDARDAAADILRTNPRFTLKAYASYAPFTNKGDLQRQLEILRKAGIPDSADEVFRAPEGHMTGEQIRAAISGRTFIDTLPEHFAGTTMTFDPSGSLDGYPQPGSPVVKFGNDEGKWWIEGDRFCRQWKRWQRGQPACFSFLPDRESIRWINRFGQFHSAMKRLD